MTSADCSTKGRMSSPAPKRSPTSFIAGNSTVLSRFRRLAPWNSQFRGTLFNRLLDQWLDALFAAVQNLPVNTLCRIHTLSGINFGIARVRLRFVLLEVSDVARQGIRTVVNQVFGKLALIGICLGIGGDMRRVDDGQVKSRFDGMIQENAVEHCAGVRLQAKGDIAHAKDRQQSRKLFLNTLDGFECFDACRL